MRARVVVIAAILSIGVIAGCSRKETKPPVNFTVLKEEALPTGEKKADLLVDAATTKEDVIKLAKYLNKTYDAYTIYDSKEIYDAITKPPAQPAQPETTAKAQAKPESQAVAATPQLPPMPSPAEIAAHTLVKKADKNSPAYWVKDNVQEEIK